MPKRGIHTLPGTMCQHDFEGKRVFQHSNGRKWSMYANPQVPGFQFEGECLGYVDDLKSRWSPAAQTRDPQSMWGALPNCLESRRLGIVPHKRS